MVSLKTWPQVGFSRNRSIEPSSSGDDDPELERVVDRLQGQGGQAAALVVEVDHLGEVDVGEHVAGDDQEPLVELVAGVAHRAGGPERRRLGGVDHADAELGAVPEVGADGVGHEGHRDHDVLEPVLAQQVDHVLHHRDVGHGQHGLGLVGGQRAQPGPLATGHDHRLHDDAPPAPAARPSAVGQRPCGPPGRRTPAAIQARVSPMMPVTQATTRIGLLPAGGAVAQQEGRVGEHEGEGTGLAHPQDVDPGGAERGQQEDGGRHHHLAGQRGHAEPHRHRPVDR